MWLMLLLALVAILAVWAWAPTKPAKKAKKVHAMPPFPPFHKHAASPWAIGAAVLALLAAIVRLGPGRALNLLGLLASVLPFLLRSSANPSHPDHTATPPAPPTSSAMTPDMARQILGVPAHATRDEIHAAYREMMRRNHPDQGGSSYLASQINQARDVLLQPHKNLP